MKFGLKMNITNIYYISWFFKCFIAILTHQEINCANRPEQQIYRSSPPYPWDKNNYLRQQNEQIRLLKIFSYLEKI